MEEIWKDIVNYEGLYQISSLGRVKSISKKEIIRNLHLNRGYPSISLSKLNTKKTFYVHRLVATAFLEKASAYTEVNHKSGIKTDNSIHNLEWCTQKMNLDHKYNVLKPAGTWKGKYNEENPHKPTPVVQYTNGFSKVWPSISEAARAGFNRAHVFECCNNRRHTHKQFKWKYYENNASGIAYSFGYIV